MTDDEARATVDDAPRTGQPGEKPRRSRRRGKRSRSRSTESQPAAPASGAQPDSASPTATAPRGNRKSGSTRSGYYPFNDGLDRFACTECLRFLPEGYPVQHRRGTATVPMRQVARRDRELLLCNGLHDGPCIWPDGVVVETAVVEPALVRPEASVEPEDAVPDQPAPNAPVTEESPVDLAESDGARSAEDGASVMQLTESL